MADDFNVDHEDSSKQRIEQHSVEADFDHGTADRHDSSPSYPSSLAGDVRLNSRGNAPVRAAVMQRMQQTHGNRAVQRYLQRSSSGSAIAPPEDMSDRIRAKSGGGSGLDSGVQSTLESGIGADMSGVRVHTDSDADHMARSVDAVAFTTGNDIFFRSGTYNPESSQGMRLLAHEATHTVQQAQGPVSGTATAGGVSISDPSDSYEQAAEQSAANVVSGGDAPAQRMAAGAPSVQREAVKDEDELPGQTMRTATYNSSVQREAVKDEDELPGQTMRTATYNSAPVQREAVKDEDELPGQTMRTSTYNSSVQRHGDEEEQ